MGIYSRVIFPWLCDFGLDRPFVARHRVSLLSHAAGDVLEIGLGTGLNLPHYPRAIRRITAVEPNAGTHRRARARMQQAGMQVDKRPLGGESLPFDDGSFDCVVSTFTLCSIAGIDRALAEIYRVLRPGGKFLFLEHGLSPDAGVRAWQTRLNAVQRWLADNCHLNRDIRTLVGSQPFASVDVEQFYLEKTPRTHGYLTMGTARR
jgi:ubiquinone/menaquinone biosynthesis C-methylase UbiE